MLQLETLLVPTDFSADAETALNEAISLAKSLGSRIHLIHIYHLPAYAAAPWGYSYPTDLFTEVRQHVAARMAEEQKRVEAEGISTSTEVVEGAPSESIVECAGRIGADLIVMGTRGLTGIKHVVLGSVAERTLRHAPCPVMTVKAPEE
jgi:nucleotide-binding universal stress UspA family protein